MIVTTVQQFDCVVEADNEEEAEEKARQHDIVREEEVAHAEVLRTVMDLFPISSSGLPRSRNCTQPESYNCQE